VCESVEEGRAPTVSAPNGGKVVKNVRELRLRTVTEGGNGGGGGKQAQPPCREKRPGKVGKT